MKREKCRVMKRSITRSSIIDRSSAAQFTYLDRDESPLVYCCVSEWLIILFVPPSPAPGRGRGRPHQRHLALRKDKVTAELPKVRDRRARGNLQLVITEYHFKTLDRKLWARVAKWYTVPCFDVDTCQRGIENVP